MDRADLRWRKSTKSQSNGQCVEVACLPGAIAIRDSKDTAGPVLIFGRKTFKSFVSGLKSTR